MQKYKKYPFYAPDVLLQRFNVSQINKVWTLDAISIETSNQTLRILHIIDLASRKVLKICCTTKDFHSAHIVKAVETLILHNQIPDYDNEEQRLIIHTDRDTYYTSQTWWELFKKYPKKIRISMSPQAQPKHNAVSERFNGNVKHMNFPQVIEFQKTLFKKLPQQLNCLPDEQQNIKYYKKVALGFLKYYNEIHIHRSLKNTPGEVHNIHQMTERIVGTADVVAVRNNNSSPIEHRISVQKYKYDLYTAFQKSTELLNIENSDKGTQFLLMRIQDMVQNEIKKLAALNQAQYIALSEQIDEQYQSIQKTLNKIEKKLTKHKNKSITLPLRDPIVHQIYEQILQYNVLNDDLRSLISFSQFRITAVLLYITGLRVNQIRELTLKDFQNAKKEERLKAIKNRTSHQERICILSQKALKELDKIQDDIDFIFIQNKFQYLGATLKKPNQPMLPTSWIRSINKTLSQISKHYNCSLILKSHSFRVGFVTRLFKLTDIQKAAEIVGHKSLDTTKRYTRYLSDSYKTKEILEKAFQNDVTLNSK